jgi:dihydropyrimidinase
MEEIVKRGIQSFKVFMAYKGSTFYQTEERILQIFQRCKELGAIVMVHAENGDLIAHNADRLVAKGVTGPEGHFYSRDGEIEA